MKKQNDSPRLIQRLNSMATYSNGVSLLSLMSWRKCFYVSSPVRHLSGRHGVQEDAVTQGKQIALGRGIGELQVTNVTPVVDILHTLSALRTKKTERITYNTTQVLAPGAASAPDVEVFEKDNETNQNAQQGQSTHDPPYPPHSTTTLEEACRLLNEYAQALAGGILSSGGSSNAAVGRFVFASASS